MTINEIRQKFLDFFKHRGHTIVESDSLVPKDDPTVLFTTAGMQQFKKQFLGQIDEYTKAASSQKCLRTDDLGEVGHTAFHHTFFEMLGNFSFGDYFKKEAIAWAWAFLTEELNLPKEKLWVSVYEDDAEAEHIWLNEIHIPEEKLVKLGDKSNFWPAEAKTKGPNGPCGPCSEIFYDFGTDVGCGKKECSPACDCGRFSEIWNLVFTQYNRMESGRLEPLPNKNIDTGMGLERLACIMQRKTNNFDIDLFVRIRQAIRKEIGSLDQQQEYLIADHIRAVVFGICDGVIPSNENRGYVIKRLIVDTCDLAANAGAQSAVIHKIVPAVVDVMKEPYPELTEKCDEITQAVQRSEEAYFRIRKDRIPELKQHIENGQDLGEIFFNYRDTYGLTLPTIIKTAQSLDIDPKEIEKGIDEFNRLMEDQKTRSRLSSKMTGDVFTNLGMDLDLPKTKFLGTTQYKTAGKILKIFKGTQEVESVAQGDEVKVILDQTPFYAESGGQIGDTGLISANENEIQIEDTQKIADIFIHLGSVKKGCFEKGETIQSQINSQRRINIMRNHTATHLLQAALRSVLGKHIRQQGSLVTDDRLRFDFSHPKGLSRQEITKIEKTVNQYILSSLDVKKEALTLDEAKKRGALAFFAEKYGQKVTMISIGDISLELCGGTHIDSIAQIGLFKIISETAIAQGIRRIEAKTGAGAFEIVLSQQQLLEEIGYLLKSPQSEIVDRIKTQAKKIKDMSKEFEKIQLDLIKSDLEQIINKAEKVGQTVIVSHIFKNFSTGLLRQICDLIKSKKKSAAVILGSHIENNAYLLVTVSGDLIKKDIKADQIIKDVSPIIQGSGGGRAQMAQAGSKNHTYLDKAIKEAVQIIKGQLTS